MSAEVLREAAKAMRETAGAANGTGAWEWRSKNGGVYFPQNTRVGRYIQAWQPDVSLAVADWLIQVAVARESIDVISRHKDEPLGAGSDMFLAQERHAVAVARAYLGGSS